MRIIETAEDLKAYVKEITAKDRAVAPEIKLPVEPTHPLAVRLSKAFERSEFGCQKPHVKEILTAIMVDGFGILPEEVGLKDRKEPLTTLYFGFLRMVVPLTNSNSHDYPIGEPALAINKKDPRHCLLRMDGDTGNNIGYDNSRFATDDEIDRFFEGYGKIDEAGEDDPFTRAINNLLKDEE